MHYKRNNNNKDIKFSQISLDSDTHDNLRTKSRRKFVLMLKYLYFQYMELFRYWAF